MVAEAIMRQDTATGAFVIQGVYHPEIRATGSTREEAVARWHEARDKWMSARKQLAA